MKSAEDNANLATIQKMQKAQEHNQRVFNNAIPSKKKTEAMFRDAVDQFLKTATDEEIAAWAKNYHSYQQKRANGAQAHK